MMKTKLTLFVTILAVALFGVGCASIPKGPPHPNAVIWNGHWYAYFPDQISWMDAKKHCENLGGHLVVIEEREENEFVWKLASASQTSGYMHLGCSRTGDNGKWVWLDGRLVSNTFHNWIDNTALGRPFNDRVSIPKIDSGGMSMNQQEDVPPKKWQVRGPSARNGFICEWENAQHTGRAITGSSKKFRLNQIKEYELRSLNENPSFEQGKSGWLPDGGEIILVPNNNDLAGGKNALTLKKPAGYGRLGTANKINLKAGKKYRTIIVLTGEIDIPRAAGDSLVQHSGGVVMGNDTYTTYHFGGKTILDQEISFPEDRSLHFQYALLTKEQITFEHFFIVEERSTASANSPEAAAAIEAAIRKAANKPTGELTKADYEKVKELSLANNQLTDGKGLEKLTQLMSLNLYNCELTSVKGLEKLTQLTELNLNNNHLTDVKDLEKLVNLRDLALGFNKLTNLKGLEKLTQLNHLDLKGNQLTDMKGLEMLNQLTYLVLESNQLTEVPKEVKNLTKLNNLFLARNQLTQAPKGLEKLANLTGLALSHNQLTEVRGLEKLTQLTSLHLTDNPDLTKAQIAQLQKALPKCKITHNATK